MLLIETKVPEDFLEQIIDYRQLCNEFPVEIGGRNFAPKQLKFFGPNLALNQNSGLYEGQVLFFEPSDGTLIGACATAVDFDWLLHVLLDIDSRTISYGSYASLVRNQSYGQQVVQPAANGCCNSRT